MLTPRSGKALGLGMLFSLCTIVGFSASGYAQSALAQQAPPDSGSASSTKPAAKPAAAPSSTATAKPSASKSQATSTVAKPAKSVSSTAARKSKKPAKPAVFLEQDQPAKAQASAAGTKQSKPKQTELAADFEKSCPDVSLTEDRTKARYAVAFEREPGSKGVKTAFGLTNTVHKTNRIEVRTRTGKELFSETGHSTAQLVKDACSAIAAPSATLAKN